MTTKVDIDLRRCAICSEGHSKYKKWTIMPNRFFPHLDDGIAICYRHYKNEYSKWRYQNKIKGDENYLKKRRERDNLRYATDNEYRQEKLNAVKKGGKFYESNKKNKKKYAQSEKGKKSSRIRNRRYYHKDPIKQQKRIKLLATTYNRQWTYLKARAKKNNIEVHLTFEEFVKIRSLNICMYCKCTLAKTGPCIDRMDSKKCYSVENCVPCCDSCNTVKGPWLTPTEMIMFHSILRNETVPPTMKKFILYQNVPEKTMTIKKRFGKLNSYAETKNICLDMDIKTYGDIIVNETCHYCEGLISKQGFGLDKVIPGKYPGFVKSNCVPCCPPCNQIKSDILTEDQMYLMLSVVHFCRSTLAAA